jgi:hypothetical protein
MPILYIHGVNTRDRQPFFDLQKYLKRIIAPVISPDPEGVWIDDVFWGDAAVTLEWGGQSRPKTRLLGQGSETPSAVDRTHPSPPLQPTNLERALTAVTLNQTLQRMPADSPPASRLIASGSATRPTSGQPLRLRDLSDDDLSDLLIVILSETAVDDRSQEIALILTVDAVVREPETRQAIATATTSEQEIAVLFERLELQINENSQLVGMGAKPWLVAMRDRLQESVSRVFGLPVYALSVATAELRVPLHQLLSLFLGDVFEYLDKRGTAAQPGEIPQRLLSKLREAQANKLQRNGEPIVVISHSMGGQIVYDAITYFLPNQPDLRDLCIDFWCATASQVGFFEEAKLFRASQEDYKTGSPVPFPPNHLGCWWNVWDHNDVLSFTTQGIISGVDDESYDSGMSLLAAHGGYLQRPSFFRKFAQKLQLAAKKGWQTV